MTRIDRPRYRRHRRYSRRFANFLTDMATKWGAYGTPITVSVAGVDELDLAATPDCTGPYRLVGAPPPELRDFDRFWLSVGALDVCEVFGSRADLAQLRSPIAIAAWPLSVAFASTDVDAGAANDIAMVGHGMQTGDGPVRLTTAGVLPTGLAAATDYYVIRVDDDAIQLASSYANAIAGTEIDITAVGSGNSTLVRALTVTKDFTAGGILEWLAQGVTKEEMQNGLVAAVDTIFTD